MTTMKTTSAQIAVALGKVCGMVQVAKRAKELVGIQSNTGIVTMTKEREALTLALEALEAKDTWGSSIRDAKDKAITAIKEALAQPEQEPVAWRNAAIRVGEDLCSVGPFGYYDMTAEQWLDWALSVVTVHATPPQRTWVGLDEEDEIDWEEGGSLRDLVEAVEAKLKEKNT